MENDSDYIGLNNVNLSDEKTETNKIGESNCNKSVDLRFNADASSLTKMEFEFKYITCEDDLSVYSDVKNSNYVIRNTFGDLLDNVESILTVDSSIEDVNGDEFNAKKNCIVSFLCIFKNLITNNLQMNESECTFDSCFSLFEECVCNFLSGNMGNILIEALMDIFLPDKNTNIYEELFIEADFEYNIVPSVLYYFLVIMAFNDFDSFENFANTASGFNRGNNLLLPISRIVSEIEFSWILCQNIQSSSNMCFQNASLLGTPNLLSGKGKSMSIFKSEYIPQIIARLINYLKQNVCSFNISLSKENSVFVQKTIINNPFSGDNKQFPFYIGRILEICLSKFRQVFISHFIQYKGPLVLLPYIQYSSIQDFFLKFFGFIGVATYSDNFYNSLPNSLLEFECSERDRRCVVDSEIQIEKLSIEDQFSNMGVSSLIYDWSIKNNFIEYLILPISLEHTEKNYQFEFGEFMNIDFDSAEGQYLISGLIEFISRLVEYLKPEQCGLPISMTSIGLLWLLYAGELNNCYFNTFISQYGLGSIDEHSLLTYEKAYFFSTDGKYSNFDNKSYIYENSQKNELIATMKQKSKNQFDQNCDLLENKFESTKIATQMCSNLLNNVKNSNSIGINIDEHLDFKEKDKANISETSNSENHHLKKTLRLLYKLFIESSLIKCLCEYTLSNEEEQYLKEGKQILKLRILNLLEGIINLAFSSNSNIIGCLKFDIMNLFKPYLIKFCDSLLLKYNDLELIIETGYLVSKLTLIKLILLHDETHKLINSLSLNFWEWLLHLLIRKREVSLISVQCKSIFEIGIQYGSYSTLQLLFREVKLIEKLSKFIYDGTDLNGFNIDDNKSFNEKIHKQRKRVFGSIKGFLMILGQLYDSLLHAILSTNDEMYGNIKMELIKNIILSHLNKYEVSDENTEEMVNLIIKNEYKSSNIRKNDKDINSDPFVTMDSQRILSLLLALSCCTKCHKMIRTFKDNSNSRNTDENQSSFSVNHPNDNCISNIENCSLSPNSKKKQDSKGQIDTFELSSNCRFGHLKREFIVNLIRMYYSEKFPDLLKCCEECECPKWSFFNVLFNLREEKTYSSGISVMPILPLEESKKIRESRKRQMKFYTPIQKN